MPTFFRAKLTFVIVMLLALRSVAVPPDGPNSAVYRSTVTYSAAEALFKAGRYRDAVPALYPFARAGDARAQAMLGIALPFTKARPVITYVWLQESSLQSDPNGMVYLALCKERGYGTQIATEDARKQFENLVPVLTERANQGDYLAQSCLGMMYHEGHGVPVNPVESIKWYRMAAISNAAEAQMWLGFYIRDGNGIAQNLAEAAEWFQRAATLGLTRAKGLIGNCYQSGIGVPKDFAQAYRWIEEAAQEGDATSAYAMGIFYHYGDHVAEDSVKAAHKVIRTPKRHWNA